MSVSDVVPDRFRRPNTKSMDCNVLVTSTMGYCMLTFSAAATVESIVLSEGQDM